MNGKVVIITGGNRGIGAEVVKCFVKAGASVCSSYYPSEEMENSNIKLLKEIKKYNGKILTIPCDLSNPKDIEILVRKTQNKFGKISNIISNAAHSGICDWEKIYIKEWDYCQSVNVRSSWLLVKHSCDDLKYTKGSVIFVTSVMTETGQTGSLHYTTSKAALIGMTRALARELGIYGVRVNAVMPGAIRTESEVEQFDKDDVFKYVIPLQALKRRGYAKDLTGTFMFLANKESDFITGQIINVDGGWVMR